MTAAASAPPDARLDADLAEMASRYAQRLIPTQLPHDSQNEPGQSLATGAAGVALVHIERALTGEGTWRQAHAWISRAVAGEVSAGDTSGLYLGVPAIGFVLDAAQRSGHYRSTLDRLDRHIADLAHRRVEHAMARIRSGGHPGFNEYDIFFGLTGIGALLLRRDSGGGALDQVLTYLVALTNPRRVDDQTWPGWWVGHDPHRRNSPGYPGGHANLGLAHGITGPLALLSHAHRRGITIDGHREAIVTIETWIEDWRQEGAAGPWWPQWITTADHRRRRPTQDGPGRPSWCYGTPGIARAGQLAALALTDPRRQHRYEQALARCLDDSTQQARITDSRLCHGAAGLYQTVWRTAHDAASPTLAAHLPRLADHLLRHARTDLDAATGSGLLEGAAGTALALHTAAHAHAPTSGWDACLLIR